MSNNDKSFWQTVQRVLLIIAALGGIGTLLIALKQLGYIGEEPEPPYDFSLLTAAFTDKDSGVRKRAVRVLGDIKDPRIVELLISAFPDESYLSEKR